MVAICKENGYSFNCYKILDVYWHQLQQYGFFMHKMQALNLVVRTQHYYVFISKNAQLF